MSQVLARTPTRIARGFDRLASIYDPLSELASLGQIHQSQIVLLPRLPQVRRALVMGGGTGRFLVALLESGRVDRAVSIDVSGSMTREALARLALRGPGWSERAEFRVGGLERVGAEERFDLVVTHCFLDLFDEATLAPVVERLGRALAPSGLWLFSDFSVEGTGVGRWVRTAAVTALYGFFRATCGISARRLPDFSAAFARLGLRELARERLAGGLLSAALYRKPAD